MAVMSLVTKDLIKIAVSIFTVKYNQVKKKTILGEVSKLKKGTVVKKKKY